MISTLKLLLVSSENLSGLKTNYSKSELIPLNLTEQEGTTLAIKVECKLRTLTII
jgi:hypothetical protein